MSTNPTDDVVHAFNLDHVARFRNAARAEQILAGEARRHGFPDAGKVHDANAREHQQRAELAWLLTAADGYIAAVRADVPGAAFAAREYMRDVRKLGYKVLAAKIEHEIQLSYNRVMTRAGHKP